MGREPTNTRRKPRADSLRNRELLLQAATEIFSLGGAQASLEAVARKAGVGIGTLYRHFPTRDALFEAVYRHEVDALGDLAEELARGDDPVEALRAWMRANIGLVATKKGMIEALQVVMQASSDLKVYSNQRLVAAVGLLLRSGVGAGRFREDITPEDLLRTVFAICYSQGPGEWQTTALRLVDIFIDGLVRSGAQNAAARALSDQMESSDR